MQMIATNCSNSLVMHDRLQTTDCSRLSISVNWTFFARCYGWGATSEYRFKIGDFAPTGAGWPKISGRRGRPTNHSSSQKTRLSDLSYGIKNLDRSFFRFVTMPAFDRRTDRQIEFSSLDRACISCSAVKSILLEFGQSCRFCAVYRVVRKCADSAPNSASWSSLSFSGRITEAVLYTSSIMAVAWRRHETRTYAAFNINRHALRFSENKITAVLPCMMSLMLCRCANSCPRGARGCEFSASFPRLRRHYLLQGGYVLPGVCLSVCLLATSRKNYWSNLHENFTRDAALVEEDTVKFWKSSWSGSRNFFCMIFHRFKVGHFLQPSYTEQAVRRGCTFNASFNLADKCERASGAVHHSY